MGCCNNTYHTYQPFTLSTLKSYLSTAIHDKMSLLKEFFNKRMMFNALVFDIPISVLFAWRHGHTRGIPFFSAQTADMYTVFLVINYVILLIIFFILFLMSRRPQKD